MLANNMIRGDQEYHPNDANIMAKEYESLSYYVKSAYNKDAEDFTNKIYKYTKRFDAGDFSFD
jgi:hypothetical protein